MGWLSGIEMVSKDGFAFYWDEKGNKMGLFGRVAAFSLLDFKGVFSVLFLFLT
jgi:hypothetical protein